LLTLQEKFNRVGLLPEYCKINQFSGYAEGGVSAPKQVAIISYGTGNIASLHEAFLAIGARCRPARVSADLVGADAVVLPGVGHFGSAVASLAQGGLQEVLVEQIHAGMPTLGICLGFQLLTFSSEEAPASPGLGLLPLRTERIRPFDTTRQKVPQLGWNSLVNLADPPPRLLLGIDQDRQLFYFANAYAVAPTAAFDGVSAYYNHCRGWLGLVEHGNIHGVQFHPEKSRSQGLQLLRNFLAIA